jgi:hypothetical protein
MRVTFYREGEGRKTYDSDHKRMGADDLECVDAISSPTEHIKRRRTHSLSQPLITITKASSKTSQIKSNQIKLHTRQSEESECVYMCMRLREREREKTEG